MVALKEEFTKDREDSDESYTQVCLRFINGNEYIDTSLPIIVVAVLLFLKKWMTENSKILPIKGIKFIAQLTYDANTQLFCLNTQCPLACSKMQGIRSFFHNQKPLSDNPSYNYNPHYHPITINDHPSTYEYGPFGELVSQTGSYVSENTYKFSTKPQDTETGYYYYGFRYYDAENGRWPNRDPIGEVGGINLYGMIGNDSINLWDRLGLCWSRIAAHRWWSIGGGNVTLDRTGCTDIVTSSIDPKMDQYFTDKIKPEIEKHNRDDLPSYFTGQNPPDLPIPRGESGVWWIGGMQLKVRWGCNLKCNDQGEFQYRCLADFDMADEYSGQFEPLDNHILGDIIGFPVFMTGFLNAGMNPGSTIDSFIEGTFGEAYTVSHTFIKDWDGTL